MPRAVRRLTRQTGKAPSVNLGKRKNAGQRGYNSKWQKARKTYLQSNPLCFFCKENGIIKSATVVDHIIPHKGNQKLFWDKTNWQSLCTHCHNSIKQRIENGNKPVKYGQDGYPV